MDFDRRSTADDELSVSCAYSAKSVILPNTRNFNIFYSNSRVHRYYGNGTIASSLEEDHDHGGERDMRRSTWQERQHVG